MDMDKLAGLFTVDCNDCKHREGLVGDCPNFDEDICQWQRELAAEAEALFDVEAIKREERWLDAPNRRGDYWISPFIEGKHIQPRIISVIDYERPGRGLEVHYDLPRESIPVEVFCSEYYPSGLPVYPPFRPE